MGLQPDLSEAFSAVDMEQALEDFDGNLSAVSALLRAFLDDRGACLRTLAGLADASVERAAAALHDVANTLDAGWCRQAAMAVRRREDHLRHETAGAVEAVVVEIRAIVQQAFDGVQAVVLHCSHCPAPQAC